MPVEDRQIVAKMFQNRVTPKDMDIAAQRDRFATGMALLPATADIFSVEAAIVGGIKGEWVRADSVAAKAAVLYLHGGGYTISSAKAHRSVISAVAVESGLAVFAPDYRLAPEHPFPAAVDDGVAAYKGLLDSGIPANRLAIAGDSAGGGLTIATLVAARDKGLPMPACAVAISPWSDLTNRNDSFRTRGNRDPVVSQTLADQMSALYLGGADAKTPLASPNFADLNGLPPLLIQVGTEEVLYDDAVALKERAEKAGVEISFESWGGMIHVWHLFHPVLSEARDALVRIGRYLKARIA